MPPYSSIRTFIEAITTGRTNITRVLEMVSNDPGKRGALQAEISKPHAFDHPISTTLAQELIQAGMTQAEVEHIQRWPNDNKERVRLRMVDAWTQGKALHFSWEIHSGVEPVTDVTTDSSGDLYVTFKSPRAGVRVTSTVNLGQIKVDA